MRIEIYSCNDELINSFEVNEDFNYLSYFISEISFSENKMKVFHNNVNIFSA